MIYSYVPMNCHKSFETEKLFASSSSPADKLPPVFSENGLSLSQKTLPDRQHRGPGHSALKGFSAGSVWWEGHACHLTLALHTYTGWMETQRAGRAEDWVQTRGRERQRQSGIRRAQTLFGLAFRRGSSAAGNVSLPNTSHGIA